MENIVLIIDDNRETVDSLASLFLQSGWMVQRALCGEDALAAARQCLPSIVISDLAMPGMSGFDVAESLKATYGNECPIMFALTGWSDSGVAKQALDAGFSLVLTKPVDFQQLLSVVRLGKMAQTNRARECDAPANGS